MQDILAEWRPVIDETIAEILPRALDEEYLSSFFGAPSYRYDAVAMQGALAEPSGTCWTGVGSAGAPSSFSSWSTLSVLTRRSI